MAYSEVTIIGYNANPPPDDGTQVSLNEIAWAKHIDKIGNPLKTAIEAIDDNVKAFSDESLSGQTGTRVVLNQTTAPTGWTKETDPQFDDTALRFVVGTVGAVTAQQPFSTVFAKTATDGHALTEAENGPHTHANTLAATPAPNTLFYRGTGGSVSTGGGAAGDAISRSGTSIDSLAVSMSGGIVSSGSGTAHSHNMDIRVDYNDVIVAVKD